MTTDELIEALERLEKEATPGPWEWEGRTVSDGHVFIPECSSLGDTCIQLAHDYEGYAHDCDLLAFLRNQLPALISALKENQRMREDVKVAQYQAWETAIRCASNTVGLFPNDTKESLHRFGAETVLRALLHVRAQCLDTAALQPQGDAKP